jgi:hypothetical protein
MSPRFAASLVLAALVPVANAQLITSWSAPSTDDGNPIPNFVASWNSDTNTGQITNLPEVTASRALAADNSTARLFASTGSSLTSFGLNSAGNFVPLALSTIVRDATGVQARSGQIESLGFANGVLFASVFRSLGDTHRRRGLPAGFYTINPATAVATLIPAAANLPVMKGMDYNEADGFMYAVVGANNAQSIVRFDLATFTLTTVAVIPASAYAGVTGCSFDGVAVGEGKVFLTTGLNRGVPIAVFNLATGTFDPSLPSPRRTAENSFYGAGATYFQPLQTLIAPDNSDQTSATSEAPATTDSATPTHPAATK